MEKLPAKPTDIARKGADAGRRRFLAQLGLAAIAAYAAPVVVQIGEEANAGGRSDGRGRRRRRGGSSRSDGRRRRRRGSSRSDGRRRRDRQWWQGGWRT